MRGGGEGPHGVRGGGGLGGGPGPPSDRPGLDHTWPPPSHYTTLHCHFIISSESQDSTDKILNIDSYLFLDVPRCSLWSSATSISDGIFEEKKVLH